MRHPRSLSASHIALIALSTVASSAAGQARSDSSGFIGQWQGTLQTPGPALRLGLTIQQGAATTLTGVLRSIDQGNAEIPTTLSIHGDGVRAEMSVIGATFTAVLTTGRDSLRGTFNQGGGTLPFVMLRQAAIAPSAGASPTKTPSTAPTADRAAAQAVDASAHRSSVMMASGVRIHSLDWGGKGVTLVFIPGLGNSAHVFDDFAPRFTDHFRVVALSRVGFGESEQPEGHGYELASRVAQIAAILDSLAITRAVLVGHSLGGDEITAFASAHSERTLGLVYLDAAYDHSTVAASQAAMAPYLGRISPPTAQDFATIAAFQQYQQRANGYHLPTGELLALLKLDERGTIVGLRTTGEVLAASMAAIQPIDYSRVRARALAVYSEWTTAADIMPWLGADSAQDALATEALRTTVLAAQVRERARFAREVPGAQIVSFHAHHYQFLTHPAETERYIRVFLRSLPREERTSPSPANSRRSRR
jgi:non-heme chloroperoxidase